MEVLAQYTSGSGASSWLRIFRGLFGSREQGDKDFRDFKKKLIEAKVKLQETMHRIDEALNKLKHRDSQLFSSAVKALASGDEIKASIYTGEVAEIRRIMKTLTTVKYAIEQVSLRLETIEALEDVGVSLAPLIPVVKSIREQVSQLIPEVTSHLDEALNSMQEVVSVTANVPERTMLPMTMSPEARSIFEQARQKAEQEYSIEETISLQGLSHMKDLVEKVNAKIKEKLREEKTPTQMPQALAIMVSRRLSFDDIKRGVLDYIRSHRGFLDIADCARRLNVHPSDVRRALEALIREGKIRVIS